MKPELWLVRSDKVLLNALLPEAVRH